MRAALSIFEGKERTLRSVKSELKRVWHTSAHMRVVRTVTHNPVYNSHLDTEENAKIENSYTKQTSLFIYTYSTSHILLNIFIHTYNNIVLK